ncbi:DUF58 domain-containing protein [Halosolutus halophilus]|uniref:DUF58 domain-containing protein n=1 Tax=Halosolutus halophilus TaxID=1552990 RepID=UPI002234EFD5|nr:DUF58 domain-containing protein [Halosolutus halophilus]
MRPTRHLWATGVLAVLLAACAVVFARPLLLVATALIGAWTLSRQYLFLAAVTETVAGVDVLQAPDTTGIRTNETTPVTLAATLEAPCSLRLALEAGVPPGGRVTEPLALSLAPGDARAQRTTDVTWPIAGRHRFEHASLTATDGLFETTVAVGPTPTVTVEPRGPRTVHVGEGGERVATTQGDHESGRLGPGLEPAELREYVPGDRADRIDWNATARLGTLYVRERDAETERPTVLCLDHRDALSTGPPGETKLDYLRTVALALTAGARNAGDPIGLVTVAETGLTTQIAPERGPTHYTTIRRRLLDLAPAVTPQQSRPPEPSPTPGNAATTTGAAGDAVGVGGGAHALAHGPAVTQPRAALSHLDRGDAFSRTLEPFYAARHAVSTELESDPLLGAIQAAAAHRGRGGTVLCTDDSDPAALRTAIRQARDQGRDVLVLLAPTVLFESGGLADLEGAYERYVAFEDFRRDLDRMAQVTALEVAPGDRLSSVLAAGRDRPRGGRR